MAQKTAREEERVWLDDEDDDSPHIVDTIHEYVVGLEAVVLFIIITSGVSFLPIFTGSYFTFGVPVPVGDATITSTATLLVTAFFLVVMNFAAGVAEEVGAWGGVLDPLTAETPAERHRRLMVRDAISTVFSWLRMGALIRFLQSQVSLALALVAADWLVYVALKRISIFRREEMGAMPTTRAACTDAQCARVEDYHVMSLIVSGVQALLLPCFVVIYQICGLTRTNYFVIGPKLAVFGIVIEDPYAYVAICVISFVDQLLASFAQHVVDGWYTNILQNPAVRHDEALLTRSESVSVYTLKLFMLWLRMFFIFGFLNTQFFFALIYIAAGLIAALVVRQLQHNTSHRPAEVQRDWMREMIVAITQFQFIESGIIATTLGMFGFFSQQYFDWVNVATIFGNAISNESQLIYLSVLVALSRIGASLYNDIIVPDVANWLYGRARHLNYSDDTLMLIVSFTRFEYWFRFWLLVQLVLKSVYFVVILAVVDIPISAGVFYSYLRHKDRTHDRDEALRLLRKQARGIEKMWSSSRSSSQRSRPSCSQGDPALSANE